MKIAKNELLIPKHVTIVLMAIIGEIISQNKIIERPNNTKKFRFDIHKLMRECDIVHTIYNMCFANE